MFHTHSHTHTHSHIHTPHPLHPPPPPSTHTKRTEPCKDGKCHVNRPVNAATRLLKWALLLLLLLPALAAAPVPAPDFVVASLLFGFWRYLGSCSRGWVLGVCKSHILTAHTQFLRGAGGGGGAAGEGPAPWGLSWDEQAHRQVRWSGIRCLAWRDVAEYTHISKCVGQAFGV